MPRDDDAAFFFGGQTGVQKDLTFDIPGIAPGAYTLSVFEMSSAFQPLGRQPIEIGAADVNGIAVNIVPPVSLRGQVRLDGTPSSDVAQAHFSGVQISLMPSDRGNVFGAIGEATPKPDGSFTLEKIAPGKYYVRASRPGAGTYLKAIRFGQEEITGKELDLSQGSASELDIVFRYGPAEIDGTVNTSGDVTAADSQGAAQYLTTPASIFLVPDVLEPDGSGIRQGATDRTGNFSIKQLPPGRYRAYAFEQVESDQLQNPDLLSQLQSKGIEVGVKEGDKKQIQVPLISAADFQQLLARLGIDAQ